MGLQSTVVHRMLAAAADSAQSTGRVRPLPRLRSAFAGTTLTILDDRFDYGESRLITLGLLHGPAVVIAPTEAQEVIRIILTSKGE